MTTSYLDPDDEVTTAVARVRAAADGQLVMVVPPGARIATSRINFRLLAREAHDRRARLAIVSGDEAVRALAISAGLLAYGSVAEAEAVADGEEAGEGAARGREPGSVGAAAAPPPAPPPPAARTGGPTRTRGSRSVDEVTWPLPWADAPPDARPAEDAAGPSGALTEAPMSRASSGREREIAALPTPPALELGVRRPDRPGRSTAAAAAGARASAQPAGPEGARDDGAPARRPRRRLMRAGVVIPVLLLLGIATAAAAAGYLYLPTAAVTIHARGEPLGPERITVTADPTVAVADPAAGLVPAERVEIPLTVTDTFPATGVTVSETRASGVVTLTSTNTFLEVPVPEGTALSTPSGVGFVTTEAVVIPRASFETGPATRDARVEASEPGPAGNVPAGQITRVPQSLSASLVTAENRQPTAGGRRVETKVATRRDVDTAVRTLTARLDEQLEAAAVDPAQTPRGLKLFPATATRGRVTPDPPANEIVDQEGPSFSVSVTATGTVIAVNEADVTALAAGRLREALPAGGRLVEGSVSTQLGEGVAEEGRVVYQVEVRAERWQPPDRQALVASIKGKSVSEARGILERYGTVEIQRWPEFIDTIPAQEGRISVSIVEPSGVAR